MQIIIYYYLLGHNQTLWYYAQGHLAGWCKELICKTGDWLCAAEHSTVAVPRSVIEATLQLIPSSYGIGAGKYIPEFHVYA